MRTLSLFSVALLAACSGDDSDTDVDTDVDTDTDLSICTEPLELDCVDELILDLGLQESVNTDAITNERDGDDWVSTVDASAGGYSASPTNPWNYVRFTDEGLVSVDIDDEAALESMEWHVSARRYVLRLNGGNSGPSCVGAVAFLEKTYDELTSVPEGLTFQLDDFYTADCSFINDSSGLEGSPQVALSAWWSYESCVKTSDVPFLVQLDSGRVVRLTIESYYASGQEGCNTSGTPGSGSAEQTWRWSFVE